VSAAQLEAAERLKQQGFKIERAGCNLLAVRGGDRRLILRTGRQQRAQ